MCFTFQRNNNDRCDLFVNFPLFFSWHYQITPIVFPMVFHSYGNWETYYFNSCVFPILRTKGPRVFISSQILFFLCSNQTVILVLFSVLFCNILFYICNTVIILFFSISLFFLFLWFKGTLRIWRSFFSIFWLLVYFLNSNYIFW